MMNRLYNGLEVNETNVVAMMLTLNANRPDSDMTDSEEAIVRKVARGGYDGAEEDMEYLIDTLNAKTVSGFEYPEANCQIVYDILNTGSWYYQEA